MRVHASDEFETKLLRKRITVPGSQKFGMQAVLKDLQQEALDFALDYFSSFDLPSSPEIALVAMRGFEDPETPLEKVKGTITFTMRIKTASQRALTLEFPFPYFQGDLLTPTIVVLCNKKLIFSQALLDDLIEKSETTRPKVIKPLQPDMRIDHLENIERQEFSAPNDPSGWSDMLSERYI